MPFGLTNAPSTFMRFINDTFRRLHLGRFVVIYLDDILVFSSSWEDHLQLHFVARVQPQIIGSYLVQKEGNTAHYWMNTGTQR